jgi:hypothetical protein
MKLPIEHQNRTAGLYEPDDVGEEYLPRGWSKHMERISDAAADVRRAIDRYGEACRQVSRMDIPREVAEKALQGMKTAKAREDSWSAIQDDPWVMNSEYTKAVKDGWKPRHMD